MTLERYRRILDDWDGFWESNHTPEPVAFRARTGLIAPGQLTSRLQSAGFRLEPVQGVESYYRVLSGPGSVAQTLEHWLGFLHVQQAVMGLPSLALGPRPGDRVLDLCAAPGGKTTHLSELMSEEGPLVAVDPKEKRIRGLLANLYRLGCTNVIVIAADGRRLPRSARFDRVLVDAPCSGEGNYRRQEGRFSARTTRFTAYVTGLQEALLRRAIELTRPGGTIVYSTCTYAPEENEAVLDRVLTDAPVAMEDIPLQLPHAPGILEWEGQRFHPDVARAWRVYPHHLDSGGLFMARLRREGAGRQSCSDVELQPTTAANGWSPIPLGFPGESEQGASIRIDQAKHELEHRFGISPSLIEGLGWMVRGKHIWAHTAGSWPTTRWMDSSEAGWRVVSVGLRALRGGPGSRETPSSHFLTRWAGEIAHERRVELNAAQLLRLLEGESLPPGTYPTGPVAIVLDGVVLGRGVVGSRGLTHELGRSYAERLLTLLSSTHGDGSSKVPTTCSSRL